MAGVNISFPFPPSVPSYAQWVSYFAQCEAVLGYTPLNNAGDTITGTLFFAPSIAPQLALSTVEDLPTASANNTGQMFLVTDATSPTWNNALTGGGTVVCLAVSNGTDWTAH
jgi:hypothetical protein